MIKNNKIVTLLVIILILCISAISYVALTYFFGTSESVYGDRLDNIEDYPLTDSDMEDIELVLEENDEITSSTIWLSGKIIYVSAEFTEEVSLEEAKKIAATSLDNYKEGYLDYYDLSFTVFSENFTLMGYKNSTNTSLVWNNNTDFETESE